MNGEGNGRDQRRERLAPTLNEGGDGIRSFHQSKTKVDARSQSIDSVTSPGHDDLLSLARDKHDEFLGPVSVQELQYIIQKQTAIVGQNFHKSVNDLEQFFSERQA